MYNSSKKNERVPRKRGANYTEAEKKILMVLVKAHNNIIECKDTSTTSNEKKKDAWAQVTKSYNAFSTTGNRTTAQIKHLYENLKQNAKKSLATSNEADYPDKLEEEKAKESLNKSDIAHKISGGGCFIASVQNKDLLVFDPIKNQVEPLLNPFDSAASYFKDDFTLEKSVDERANKTDEPLTHENQKETQGQSVVSTKLKKRYNYKAAYFKQKFENAILERRRIYQDMRLRQKEYMLLSKKLKLEIDILEKQK
ncbi:unnamed protein product [Euphydryas editha]|uniref:Regulatory protein zeste n=1 Tax=Euphydryas editha TaxID=104508 RepID=A0AAU9UG85_EUPED|nr:unnamed protein product [Euphydryas editha]